jgi:FkbM family methyltransferase
MTPVETYFAYIESSDLQLSSHETDWIHRSLNDTDWESPRCGKDWNNVGVLSLIEAETCTNLTIREACLEIAAEAFRNGASDCSLCLVHLALIHGLLGESKTVHEIVLNQCIDSLHLTQENQESEAPGLLYWPHQWTDSRYKDRTFLELLRISDRKTQLRQFAIEVLCHAEKIFYAAQSIRFLHVGANMSPLSINVLLRLGISTLLYQQKEGIFYLYRAYEIAPEHPAIIQSLFLAYWNFGEGEYADYWRSIGQALHGEQPTLTSQWLTITLRENWTYVPFDETLLLAVEPAFKSIVTSVLLATGDWFENEMEFWRKHIQPGMTVIDVGSNSGVYTFSAARRVGSTGKVLAIEPLPQCVSLLQESCRINNIDWIKMYAGAASDRTGVAKLAINTYSELNKLVMNEENTTPTPGGFLEVPCLILDSLIDDEQLITVDFLKIDAEEHEISVLNGAIRILQLFRPCILYENILPRRGSYDANIEVANFLTDLGYQLFWYQPYLEKLVSVKELEDLNDRLNIIAVHQSKLDDFSSNIA